MMLISSQWKSIWMPKKKKSKSIDIFDFIEYHAKKAYPKSKTPICDFAVNLAGECDPEERVLNINIAKQLEYHNRFYRNELQKLSAKLR
jgi:hypothetical protein